MNNNKNILIIIVICILGFLFLRKINKKGVDKVPPPQVAEPSDEIVVIPEKQNTLIKSKKITPKTGMGSYQVRSLTGVRMMPIRSKGGVVNFDIGFNLIEKGCAFGDIDYIEMDWRKATKGSPRVTLEPLSGSGTTVSKTVTPAQMRDGVKLPITLEGVKKPILYGLYLCGGSGSSCRNKRPVDFDKTQKRSMQKGRLKQMPDTLYSFSLLRVAPTSVAMIPTGQAKVNELKRLLPQMKQNGIRKLNNISKRLGTYAPTLKYGTVFYTMNTKADSCRSSISLVPEGRR